MCKIFLIKYFYSMKKVDKTLILKELQEYYGFKRDSDFADFLGISSQVYSNWLKRNTFDIEILYTKCVDVSASFLITGKGEKMQKIDINNKLEEEPEHYKVNNSSEKLKDQLELIDALRESVIDLRTNNRLLQKLVEEKVLH